MKFNKKIVLLLVVLASIVSIGFVIYKINLSKQKEQRTIERFNEPPQIPNYLGSGLPINLDLTKKDFVFPNKLPYLSQYTKTPFTQDEIQKISSALSFNFDPLTVKDVKNGDIFIWNSDRQSLLVTPKIRKIKTVPPTSPRVLIRDAIDKKLKENQYKITADEFLNQKIPFALENLKFSGFTYLKTESGLELFRKTTKEDSQFIQLNYYQSPLDYPLLNLNPQDSQIIIQFLKDGSVLNFEGTFPSSITESQNKYPLKNYEEFVNSIEKSILVSLNDGNINLLDIKKSDLRDININKVSLAYLIDQENNEIIQPVFLLEGISNVLGHANSVSALFYLPAFSQLVQP